MDNLVELFCDVDDFCQQFAPKWEAQLLSDGTRKQRRRSEMSTSERMTIVIAFHQSNHLNFNSLCIGLVQRYWSEYFSELLSNTRIINTISELIVPMCAYFQTVKGESTGIAFVDSTSLKYATISEFLVIAYLKVQPSEEKELWDGFSALSFIY